LATSPLFDGRYVVERELGRGAMGVVHLARDVELDRLVALKVAAAPLDDVTAISRFRNEAKALATVRHDHVVQVFAAGRSADQVYFAMEYVDGETLEEILLEHEAHAARIPLFRTLTLLRRIAAGLDAVHAVDLVHRDVKPSNIVVEAGTGRPVLVDFGVVLTPRRASDPDSGGTPLYMAPEQVHRLDPISARTDQYALACLAFEMLTGAPPFDAERLCNIFQMHLAATPPAASERAALPKAVDAVLARGLAKSPGSRFGSCSELVAALDVAMGNFVLDTRTVPPPAPASTPPAYTRSILIVDADHGRGHAVARALESTSGTRCTLASTSSDALVHALEATPDLVVLDLEMPGLGAVETLARLRELPGNPPVVVGMCSADPGARWRYSVLGVSRFVESSLRPFFLSQMLLDVLAGGAPTVPPPPLFPGRFASEPVSGVRSVTDPSPAATRPDRTTAKAKRGRRS
jgi:serine/threonine-protein kinase